MSIWSLFIKVLHIILPAFLAQSIPFPGPGAASAIISYCSVPGYPTAPESSDTIRLWYSADCITYSGSVCSTPANGSTVTNWNDRSGNGYNAVTNSGTLTFNTNQINGLPALTPSSSQANISQSIPNTGHFSVFVMLKSASGNVFSDGFTGYQYTSNPHQQVVSNGNAVVGTGTASLSSSSWQQINTTYTNSGPSLTFRLNEASDAVNGSTGTQGMPQPTALFYNRNNGGEFLTGQIAEIIEYSDVLSAANIVYNECYLYGKYGR